MVNAFGCKGRLPGELSVTAPRGSETPISYEEAAQRRERQLQ